MPPAARRARARRTRVTVCAQVCGPGSAQPGALPHGRQAWSQRGAGPAARGADTRVLLQYHLSSATRTRYCTVDLLPLTFDISTVLSELLFVLEI